MAALRVVLSGVTGRMGTVLAELIRVDDGIELVGGSAHPAIGAPMRSGTQTTGDPPASTFVWRGMIATRPPCAHRMVAAVVSSGGTTVLEEKSRGGPCLPSIPDRLI